MSEELKCPNCGSVGKPCMSWIDYECGSSYRNGEINQKHSELCETRALLAAVTKELERAKTGVPFYSDAVLVKLADSTKEIDSLRAEVAELKYLEGEAINSATEIRWQLADVTAERDEADIKGVHLCGEYASVEAERDQWKALAEKLGPYASRHNCDERAMQGPCSCGYRRVLAELKWLQGDQNQKLHEP